MSIDAREPLQSIAPGQLAAAVLAGNENPPVKAMGMWLEPDPAENLYRELKKDDLDTKIWKALDGRTHIHRTKQGSEERALALGTRLRTRLGDSLRCALMIHSLEVGGGSWRGTFSG